MTDCGVPLRLTGTAVAVLLATTTLGCTQEAGRFSVAFDWMSNRPEPGTVWIHARVEERTKDVNLPGEPLRTAPPVLWAPGAQLAFDAVLHGDDRVVVVEVHEGETASARPIYFGLSEPFSLHAGDDREVPVALALATTPSLREATAAVTITNANNRGRIGTNLAQLRVEGRGIATIEVAKDPDFVIGFVGYAATDLQREASGDREVFTLEYDLNRGIDCTTDACDGARQIIVRVRNAQGYASEAIALRVVLDREGPNATNIQITPPAAKLGDTILLTFVTDEPIDVAKTMKSVAPSDPFVFTSSVSQQYVFSTVATQVGTATSVTYRLTELVLQDDLGNVRVQDLGALDVSVTVDPIEPEISNIRVPTEPIGNVLGTEIPIAFDLSEPPRADASGLVISLERPEIDGVRSRYPLTDDECVRTPKNDGTTALEIACTYVVTDADLAGPRELDSREVLIQVVDPAGNRKSDVAAIVFDLEPPRLEALSFSPSAARDGTDVFVSMFLSDDLDPSFTPQVEMKFAANASEPQTPVATPLTLTAIDGRAYLFQLPVSPAVPDGIYRVASLVARDARVNTATITVAPTFPALVVDSRAPELRLVDGSPNPSVVGRTGVITATVEIDEPLVATTTITLGGNVLTDCTNTATTVLPIEKTCTYVVTGTEIPLDTTRSLALVATTIDAAGNRALVDSSVLFDFEAPVVRTAAMNPQNAGVGATLIVDLVANEDIVAPPPTLTLTRADGATIVLGDLVHDGASLTYSALVGAGAPQGVFELAQIELTDALQNTAMRTVGPLSATVDTAAPQVTVAAAPTIVARGDMLTLNIGIGAEAPTGRFDVSVGGLPVTCPSPAPSSTVTCTFTVPGGMAEGPQTVVVRAADLAGNPAEASTTIEVDATPATLVDGAFSPAIARAGTVLLQFVADEPVVNPPTTLTIARVGGGATSIFDFVSSTGTALTYTLRAFPALDGVYRFSSLQLEDRAGNVAPATLAGVELLVDRSVPTISNLTVARTVAPTDVARLGDSLQIAFTVAGTNEAIAPDVALTIGGVTIAGCSGPTTSPTVTCTTPVTTALIPMNQELLTAVVAEARDGAGNTHAMSTTIFLDALAPRLDLNGAVFSPNAAGLGDVASLTITADEVLGATPTLTFASANPGFTLASAAGVVHAFTMTVVPGSTAGVYVLSQVGLVDRAGNTRNEPVTGQQIRIDPDAPVFGAVTVTPARANAGTTVQATMTIDEAESIAATVEGAPMSCAPQDFETPTLVTCTYLVPTGAPTTRVASIVIEATDHVSNTQTDSGSVVIDLTPPAIQDALVAYQPSATNPLANITAAGIGTTVSLSIVADEEIQTPPSTFTATGPGGSALTFSLVPASVNVFGARFEATVTNANNDGVHVPSLTLVDVAGNNAPLTLTSAPVDVRVTRPVLTIAQNQVSYVRAPTAMGAQEPLGTYTLPAGPNYFALAPPDGLTDAATLPANTFTFAAGATPVALRVYSDALRTNLVSGVITPLANQQWHRDDLRLLNQDVPSVFVAGIDAAGNESDAVLVQNAWYVASSANGPNGTRPNVVSTWRAPAPPRSGGNPVPPTAALASPDLSSVSSVSAYQLVPESRFGPVNRTGHGFTFDSGRGRAVVFGGHDWDLLPLGDTWEWDGDRWLQRFPIQSPSPRRNLSMAYDPILGVTLMFGGVPNGPNVFYADTWAWDGIDWVDVTPSTVLPVDALSSHAMVFDAGRGRLTLFLTTQAVTYVYEWNGFDWVDRTPVGGLDPGPVAPAGAAYDGQRGRVVMAGGTWEWDGAAWIATPASGGGGATGASIAYDALRGVTVSTAGGFTFHWDGTTWTDVTATYPGHGMSSFATNGTRVTYDTARRQVLHYGGGILQSLPMLARNDDGWYLPSEDSYGRDDGYAYDSVREALFAYEDAGGHYERIRNRWQAVAGGPTGPATLTYDPIRQRIVVVTDTAETWEWDGMSWVSFVGGNHPGAGGVVTYDIGRARAVLFRQGGSETWERIGTTWQLAATTGPTGCGRFDSNFANYDAIVYDDARSVVLMLSCNETWTWNGTWTQRAIGATVPNGIGHLVSIPQEGRVLAYGGGFPFGTPSLVTWDGSTWTDETPANVPVGRIRHDFYFDPYFDKVIIEDGITDAGTINDRLRLDRPDVPAITLAAQLPNDVVTSPLLGVRVRASCGGIHPPFSPADLGAALYAWSNDPFGTEDGSWLPLATNTAGIPIPSVAAGTMDQLVTVAPERFLGSEGRMFFGCRPDGGSAGASAAVQLDYIEARVHYVAQP
ncbi:MAG: hypothetical protein RIT81_25580 [Deltaproteobacteria bacterium]